MELPCDGDGMCMVCKSVPPDGEVLVCNGCASPWHMCCLVPPLSFPSQNGEWTCPDCSLPVSGNGNKSGSKRVLSVDGDNLVALMRAIEADSNLNDEQKAKKRQELLMSRNNSSAAKNEDDTEDKVKGKTRNQVLDMLDESLKCGICLDNLDLPVTTPCGHNFCLKCFNRCKQTRKCPKCRAVLPQSMIAQPRINSALVMVIRTAKAAANLSSVTPAPSRVYHTVENENKPDKAFTTDRAKRKGLSNAASGKIFVTVPPDHFGPIPAENDPRKQGVLVGESWSDRLECRQWGAHLPHVAGISGQADYGAQSIALSGGYIDDEDHGEWFLYTGSGGRDLSGNKRTNKYQSFDQKFEKQNEALRVSCKMGYPVRVVRSCREKRSSYAPEEGIRYDGIYRVEMCWRKNGVQGFKVCRYLLVRCDNEPAPWTSDECGDKPRPLPKIKEMEEATDITTRKDEAAWDYKDGKWGWTRDPPPSRKKNPSETGKRPREKHQKSQGYLTIKQRLLKEFGCELCKKVLNLPLCAPCGHNFCKACLEGMFAGQKDFRERSIVGGRSLRAQKIVKKCPCCEADITDYLANPQVNRQMEELIESLKEEDKSENGDEENQETKETSEAETNSENQETKEASEAETNSEEQEEENEGAESFQLKDCESVKNLEEDERDVKDSSDIKSPSKGAKTTKQMKISADEFLTDATEAADDKLEDNTTLEFLPVEDTEGADTDVIKNTFPKIACTTKSVLKDSGEAKPQTNSPRNPANDIIAESETKTSRGQSKNSVSNTKKPKRGTPIKNATENSKTSRKSSNVVSGNPKKRKRETLTPTKITKIYQTRRRVSRSPVDQAAAPLIVDDSQSDSDLIPL